MMMITLIKEEQGELEVERKYKPSNRTNLTKEKMDNINKCSSNNSLMEKIYKYYRTNKIYKTEIKCK